jgi:uncharacterized membrane protein YccC
MTEDLILGIPDIWVGGVIGAWVAATLVLLGTADWEYLRARWRGHRNMRRARRRRSAEP